MRFITLAQSIVADLLCFLLSDSGCYDYGRVLVLGNDIKAFLTLRHCRCPKSCNFNHFRVKEIHAVLYLIQIMRKTHVFW